MLTPILLASAALLQATPVVPPPAAAPDTGVLATWTPQRAYDARHKRFSDFESLAAQAARANVVFFGEQHDDPGTHRMERALLEAVARRRSDVVVSLEMFERDVQGLVNDYLADRIDEATFAHQARPWPNYSTDYRPLVEFAKAHGWRVVAANIPRKMAAAVSRSGLEAITNLTDSTRRWAASAFDCPHDDYFKRFGKVMGEHPMGPTPPSAAELAAMTERFYLAQCAKDETMAESLAAVAGSNDTGPLVIHFNGAFHSDFGEGTAARLKRRLPDARVMVISGVPVASLDTLEPKPWRKVADWVVFTLKPAETQ